MDKNQSMPIKIAVVTISDSCFNGTKEDGSGKQLAESIRYNTGSKLQVFCEKLLPDDALLIEKTLRLLATEQTYPDVIITTGGTGFSHRDVTPEATKRVLEKDAPGIVAALLNYSLQSTQFAALSRLAAGIYKKTLIVNFPGSVKAVKECWQVLAPLLPHAVALLRDDQRAVGDTHDGIAGGKALSKGCGTGHHSHQCGRHDEAEIQKALSHVSVVDRPRESPFPLIAFDEALKLVLENCGQSVQNCYNADLSKALYRVLAEDVLSKESHPPYPASIKDGYAVITSDGAGERQVVGVVTAGDREKLVLQPGSCVRISTGAPIPMGADAVVQVEDTKLLMTENDEEKLIYIHVPPQVEQDIRPIGTDIEKNELILHRGTIVTSAEIGLLATIGHNHPLVYKFPKVVILSTGTELVESDSVTANNSLPYGCIRDSNRPMLISLLKQNGWTDEDLSDGHICPDDRETMHARLQELLSLADVLICSGGVSMGEKDLLKQILLHDLKFKIHFARVLMKPGKPVTFASGELNGKKKYIFGLPGNPVSAWVTAILFALPGLRVMAGHKNPTANVIAVKLLDNCQLDPRPQFVRAISMASRDSSNTMICASLCDSNQNSSRLLSARNANLLLILPPATADRSIMEAGHTVPAMIVGQL